MVRPARLVLVPALAALALVGTACSSDDDTTASLEDPFEPSGVAPVEVLTPEVLGVVPHDSSTYTQGLLLDEDGRLFESGGQYGRSDLAEVDPETGRVLRSTPVDDEYFAEGLALVDDHLVQITWKEGTAFVYDAETFDVIDELTYAGEGWGLCSDGERLVMSDGSATLTFRDPESFEATGRVEVTLDGGAVERLNELECVGDRVYANVYQTDRIVEIDPSTGAVTAVIDAAELTAAETNPGHDVLNGIAYDPATETFWLTGKWWENRYRVQFVPRTAEPTDVDGDRPEG